MYVYFQQVFIYKYIILYMDLQFYFFYSISTKKNIVLFMCEQIKNVLYVQTTGRQTDKKMHTICKLNCKYSVNIFYISKNQKTI